MESGLYGMYRLADAQNSMATLMGVSLVFAIIAWIILITSGIILVQGEKAYEIVLPVNSTS